MQGNTSTTIAHAKKAASVSSIESQQKYVSSVVESLKPSSPPENEMILFSIEDPEHDMSTYIGRFKSFRKICNPFIAFYSNTRIIEMQEML